MARDVTMNYTIQRYTNGNWRTIAHFSTEFEAMCSVKGLNEHGQWEYRWIEQ